MPLPQMSDFTFKHINQPDELTMYSAAEVKQKFDSRAEEIRNFLLNELIPALESITDGNSGADNIGATAITDLTGTTVQTILESLKTYIDNINTNLQSQINSNDTDISNLQAEDDDLQNQITTHKSSGDHDSRYYTKSELDGYLRGGDTLIKEETFTIVTADNGDGTFTYSDKDSIQHTGTLDIDGYQVFLLQEGTYPVGENKIEVFINDTLRRSHNSGGLKEVSETEVAIDPQGNGAEITIKYYERLGLMGEHAISHEEGGSDQITVTEGMLDTTLANKINNTQTQANTNATDISNLDSRVTQNETDISNLQSNKINGVGTSKITVSATEPSTPAVNDIWIDISS